MMISGSKGQNSEASLLAKVQSTKQSGIIGGKIPFDPNII